MFFPGLTLQYYLIQSTLNTTISWNLDGFRHMFMLESDKLTSINKFLNVSSWIFYGVPFLLQPFKPIAYKD